MQEIQAKMQDLTGGLLGPKKEIHDLHGKVALITGGAEGIGFEIARGFASVGCRVIMTNRREDQGNAAIADIKKDFPDAKVEWFGCDNGTLAEVKEAYSKFAEKEERLDLLILSAGINTDQFGLTNDKIDRHFQVNWLAHFYSCNLLFPLLRKTANMPDSDGVRIVFESSEMHRFAPSNTHYGSMEEINDSSTGPTQLYGRTKLAMILGAKFGLAEKAVKKDEKIYCLAVHPGAVNTQMQESWKRAYPGITGQIFSALSKFVSRSPEQGAYSALWAATSPKIVEENIKFCYYQDPDSPGKESSQGNDKWLGEALWDLSHRMVRSIMGEDALGSWDK